MISAALALSVLRGGSPSTQPAAITLALAQGETASYAVTVTRSDTGEAEDLTGGQLQFAVRKKAGAPVELSRQCTITTAASGLATLEFASADTAALKPRTYVCDVWYTDATGNRYPVTGISALVLRAAVVTEGLAVTVLPEQTPLAQGPTGATGPQGPAGAAGAAGATGPQGPAGPQGKGCDWFDVTAYGAVGNGTADDTSAIASALAAAAAAGGGTVYFPRGTGAGAMSPGDAVGVSAASAGRGKKVTSGQILGRCANTVAASVDASIFLIPSKEAY